MAGVSTATVSRTLNEPHLVKEPTREAVEKAVQALGYTPNFGGKALASNRTNTVGAVIPTMTNAIFAQGLQTLQDGLSARNITLLVATSAYAEKQEADQIRALLARGVDGLVLIGAHRDPAIYDLLEARGVPYVLMWIAGDELSRHFTVGFDNFETAQRVTEHVMNEGHRRIGMIAGETANNDRAAQRLAGVRASIAAAGLDAPAVSEAPYHLAEGEAAAHKMLSASPRPTAVICGNDVIAAGVVKAARALKLSVPDDVSVIGFDDLELALIIDPPLSTVRVPHRRMGKAAAELLVDWIQTGKRPESVVYPADFIRRETLAPPPKEQ